MTDYHNSHYKELPIEPIEAIQATLTEEEYRGFLKGSWLKYKLRAGHKGEAQTDLDKAEWYEAELKTQEICKEAEDVIKTSELILKVNNEGRIETVKPDLSDPNFHKCRRCGQEKHISEMFTVQLATDPPQIVYECVHCTDKPKTKPSEIN